MSRSRRRSRDRVRRDDSFGYLSTFGEKRARVIPSTNFVPLDTFTVSQVIYPERRKPARVYTPSKASLKFKSPWMADVRDVQPSDIRECVQRTVRKQVIHALGLAGAKRIFSKAGAGKKTPSRRKC